MTGRYDTFQIRLTIICIVLWLVYLRGELQAYESSDNTNVEDVRNKERNNERRKVHFQRKPRYESLRCRRDFKEENQPHSNDIDFSTFTLKRHRRTNTEVVKVKKSKKNYRPESAFLGKSDIYPCPYANKSMCGEENKTQPCDLRLLLANVNQINVISPENIVNLVGKENFDFLCSSLMNSIIKGDTYIKLCDPKPQNPYFKAVIDGMSLVHEQICANKAWQKVFLCHAPCVSTLRKEFQNCIHPGYWYESADESFQCRLYGEVISCYSEETRKGCGLEASKTVEALVTGILKPFLIVNCHFIDRATQTIAVTSTTQANLMRLARILGKGDPKEI